MSSGGIPARIRAWGLPPRVLGVDVARGLAVIGMFAAHVAVQVPFDWSPHTWSGLSDGKPSVLFALLAGVSIAILSRRDGSGQAIAVRAAIVYVLGLLLMLLPTNVAVILPSYGALFLLALPFRRADPRKLAVAAAVLAAVAPALVLPLREQLGDAPAAARLLLLDPLITGYYPALIWIAYVLAGIAIGRLDLLNPRVAVALVAVGGVLAGIGYGLGAALEGTVAREPWVVLFTAEPHSDTPFDVIGTGGTAIAVLGLCLLLSRMLRGGARWLLLPLGAVGAMALTAYTAQLIAIAALGIPVPGDDPSNTAFWVLTLVTVAGCCAWVLLVGRGPLEAAMHAATHTDSGGDAAGRLNGAVGPGGNREQP
ncbi:MAG TPA: heparan-alpha-glucosaminide N-acetyltransferase domain-containing protein [Rhodoglobus sp.]|nr:heparan-alpha-glucosaminide N-acetyltransferase domain-containing protein [Rhodoglobus sp.]